jgi:xanthine dehydrogenase accessory factor
MKIWKYITDQLNANKKLAFMCVLESIGSSPGRQGFKMAVSEDGTMSGSIGGGIMEHKMVELCRTLLIADPFKPFIKRQIHQDVANEKSGMICSGEQTIVFYHLDTSDLSWVESIYKHLINNKFGVLNLSFDSIKFRLDQTLVNIYSYSQQSETSWTYQEQLGFKQHIYILGAGHVGLALSEMMCRLGFYVVVMDDRDALNTMYQNTHAHHTEVIDYETIGHYIPENDHTYVVLVSFGYRTDKVLLKQCLGRKYKYLGMMGSAEKVKVLYKELQEEGFSKEQLDQVHSPIGMSINSKTPEEIAVSIAAEIIEVKNG